jgi:patched 1 protein
MDVVADSASFQWGTLVGGYLVLVAYGALSHAGFGRAGGRSHAVLGAWGIVVVSVATLLSFGAYGYLGIPSTGLAAGVVPFVSLGVGAVDMFVVSQAYVDAMQAAAPEASAETVVAEVLRGTGPSIVFTTLINLVASLVAAQMPIRVMEYFCYQMAIAVAANLLALLLLFVPTVVLDCRLTLAAAAAAGREGGGCCLRREAAEDGSVQGGRGSGVISRFASKVYAPWLLSVASAGPVLLAFGAL